MELIQSPQPYNWINISYIWLMGDGLVWWSDKTSSFTGSSILKISFAEHRIVLHGMINYEVI